MKVNRGFTCSWLIVTGPRVANTAQARAQMEEEEEEEEEEEGEEGDWRRGVRGPERRRPQSSVAASWSCSDTTRHSSSSS